MSIKNDIENLPLETRRNIARAARKLLSDEPVIHTIIIDRKKESPKVQKPEDLEFLIFFDMGSETETQGIISESIHYGGSGTVSENYRIYDPGKDYVQSAPSPSGDEAEALFYKSDHAYQENRTSYLEFLKEHQKFFSKKDSPNIITMNSPEMEKGNPLYYKLHITHCFEKGYVIYNRLLKPFITMHNIDDLE